MSPRGVTTPEVRQRLFDAAQSVLNREGPAGLTSRAITTEAGVAKGLIHNRFGDLDEFLAQFVMDRARLGAAGMTELARRVGEGTVASNLAGVALSLLDSHTLAVGGLALSRPTVFFRIRELTAQDSELPVLVNVLADYLERERDAGRVAPDADSEMLALAFVGTLHHLVLSPQATAEELRARIPRLARALVGEGTA